MPYTENPSDDPPSRRGARGPWMLKAVGIWGTGQRSRFDFEVYIDDLGQVPDEQPPGTDAELPATRAFLPAITEDVEPALGLDVALGKQMIRDLGAGSWVVYE